MAAILASRVQASQTHTVQQGHNLWRIARKYRVPVQSLAAANGLREEGELKLNTRLIVPGSSSLKVRISKQKSSIPAVRQQGKLVTDRICVRSGPGTGHRKLTVLDSDASLVLIASAKGWRQVLLPGGTKGWIRSDFIKPGKMIRESSGARKQVAAFSKKKAVSRKTASIRSRKRQAQLEAKRRRIARGYTQPRPSRQERSPVESGVIDTAFAHQGIRYRSGGTTSRSGFDCSGFTRYVYGKSGVRLPHSSRSQYGVGKLVSKSRLRSGDLVFFRTNGRGISHVGIYIGNGKFIHASNHSRGVTVDSIHSAYYSKRYVGARRVK
jgi:cell wall-associated NlpC family hydrolase